MGGLFRFGAGTFRRGQQAQVFDLQRRLLRDGIRTFGYRL